MRDHIRALCLCVFLTAVFSAPAAGAQASLLDRQLMSIAIADYIHNRDFGTSNPFHAVSIEVGATVIDWPYALADWRSADGKEHGQVSFVHLCDHWNVESVSRGQRMRVSDVMESTHDISAKTATKLIADLLSAEDRHVAFLKPSHAGVSC
jgi:hypothetical protein